MNFSADIPERERNDLALALDSFVLRHAVHHRPIAVVSSGGTAADLELNSVRCLDNFSTGLRGAVSVEEFLKRGYAVIHLWRRGSAAPFARVLNQYLGVPANQCLDVESLGRLFAIPGENEGDDLVQKVLREERDPWLSSDEEHLPNGATGAHHHTTATTNSDQLEIHRALSYSTSIQRALRERSNALSEGRLLIVDYRSVEEYLGKLELCAKAVKDCQSLALFFLAAAVSDFYIPKSDRAEHKIQSNGGAEELLLRLKPVPKTLGLLRSNWAPDAFVVSFKLETDMTLLRHKSDRAVEQYACHMVIGNLLHTRHEKVWILAPDDQRNKEPSDSKEWQFAEVSRSLGSSVDTLESSILDVVVQSHFEFISWHFHANSNGNDALKAAKNAQTLLEDKKRRVQREILKRRVISVGLELAGALLAVGISYTINSALRRRLNG